MRLLGEAGDEPARRRVVLAMGTFRERQRQP